MFPALTVPTAYQSQSHEVLTESSLMLKLGGIENGYSGSSSNGENDQMLPIFQRLLLEKKSNTTNRQQHQQQNNMSRDAHKNASCPNILVKCDIVEYL